MNKRFPKKYTSSYANSNNYDNINDFIDNKKTKNKHFYNREDDEFRNMNPLKYLKHSFQRKQEFKFCCDFKELEDEFFNDDFFKSGFNSGNHLKTEAKTIKEEKIGNVHKYEEEIKQVINAVPDDYNRKNDKKKRLGILQELLKYKKDKDNKNDKDDDKVENEKRNERKLNKSGKKCDDDTASISSYSIRNKYKRKEK